MDACPGTVEHLTLTGQLSDAATETETTYYRGMSDDNDSTAVTLTDSQGGVHDDANQLAGQPLEVTKYNFSGGPVASSAIYSYWVSGAAATRDRSAQGLQDLTANATGLVETWSRQTLHSGSATTWRDTETDTSYYSAVPTASSPDAYFGLPQYTYVHGDLSLTGNNQVRCTTTSYAPAVVTVGTTPDATQNMVGLVSRTETDADPCGGTNPAGASAPTAAETNALTAPVGVSRPADVVSGQCTVYDNQSLTQAGPQATTSGCPASTVTNGDVSEVYDATGYTGSAFTYQLKNAAIYDSIGRVTASWDGNGNKTTTSYTTNSSGLTTGVTTTNPLGQASSVTLDPARGLTTGTSDINGITTITHYDGLGRVIAEWDHSRADTDPANTAFTYTTPAPPAPGSTDPTAPWAVTSSILNDFDLSDSYASSTTLYDALLRVRQTQDPTQQGGSVVTDTFYDSRGWAFKTNTQWWASGNAPGTSVLTVPDSQVPDQTVTDFDGLGRPVLATSYDDSSIKSQTATAYDQATAGDGDATITVPLAPGSSFDTGHPFAGGAATATVTDALGRTSQLDQYTTLPSVAVTSFTSPPTTTVAITGGTTQATDYTWDNPMHQATVTDEATGQAWVSDSNLLGQVTSQTDPDAGTDSMAYDGNGNLTQAEDANGATLSWTYDALSRKTAEYDTPPGSKTPAEIASWAYDNSNNAVPGMSNPNGHLTTATRYVGNYAYTQQYLGFNAFGEPYGQTVTLPADPALGALATSYQFSYTYEPVTGLPVKTIYPASPGAGALPAETTVIGYSTANGVTLPTGIAGLNSYGANVTYTALGQPGIQEIGDPFGAYADITNTFDPYTGLLTDTSFQSQGSSTVTDDTSYTYDPAGNPTQQTETRLGTTTETQCFSYDTLNRLQQAWTATDNCAADPSANSGATVGDGVTGAAYWTNWKYSPLGLRTTETDHGLNGAADTTTSYTYNGNGASQPDTLTSTAATGGDPGTASYRYDDDGNVTSRTITDTTTTNQTLAWNDDGTLSQVTTTPGGTSNYIYDADGNLLLQKDPGKTTLYLPGEQLTLTTSTGAVNGTRYYPMPGGGQAVRTGTTNSNGTTSTSYLFELTDQHGTAALTVGSALTASSATWREFTPFGGPRGPAVTWVDNHGFLDKPTDTATGLTNVGARWYDPATGTFQSLDPVFEVASPQQHNGYTYAADNPVTNSDPTGLLITGGGGGSCDPNAHGCGGSVGNRNGVPQGGTNSTGAPPPSSYGGCQPSIPGCPGWSAALSIITPKAMPLYATFMASFQDTYNSAGTPAYTFDAIYAFCANNIDDCGGNSTFLALADIRTKMLTSAGLAGYDNIGLTNDRDAEGGLARGFETGLTVAAEESLTAETGLADVAAAEEGASSAAEETGSEAADEAGATCGGASFTASTKVLLASGAAIPISQLKTGRKVLATSTGTGKTQPETITAVLVHHDTDLYDLKIRDHGKTSVIDTTSSHLFWVPGTGGNGGRWVKAGSLKYGTHLRTPSGSDTATVTGGWIPPQRDGWMWDLTVPGGNDHDFYINTTTADILVHNCDIGHADIHQFPGIQAGKSQFFDQVDLSELSDTSGVRGILQSNGNMRHALSRAEDIGVDRTTGLPTNIYTVIRAASGKVVTMFPGTSPMG
jgi:RHS repeat-associated protein